MFELRNLLPGPLTMNLRADTVFEALQRGVLEGKLPPGEWLRQETIAASFGVSHITVRDALNRLVAEGLAVRTPYKGVRVIELSAADLREVYTLRAELEGWAAELAAPHMTHVELARMRALLPDSYVTADPASLERARRVNREFHLVFIQASGHKLLERMLRDVWNRMDPMTFYHRTLATNQGVELRLTWGERDRQNHLALVAAFERQDGGLARRLVSGYIQETWQVLEEKLEAVSNYASENELR